MRRVQKMVEAKAKHVELTGRVLWAWNELHKSYGFIFRSLFPVRQMLLADTIWQAIASDSAQRDMLAAGIEIADGLRTRERERLLWALARTRDLALYRNDIVHGVTSVKVGWDENTTGFATAGNPFKRLMRHARADTPLTDLMAAMEIDIQRLDDYASNIWRRIGKPDPLPPSPRKPKLRSLALVAAGHARTKPSQRPQSNGRRNKTRKPKANAQIP